MAGLGWQELVIVLVIVLIIFGAGRLPEVAKSLGQGVKEFRREAGAAGWDSETLDGRVEAFLAEKAGVQVDFEVPDAMAKLERLHLIESASAGRWRADVGECQQGRLGRTQHR